MPGHYFITKRPSIYDTREAIVNPRISSDSEKMQVTTYLRRTFLVLFHGVFSVLHFFTNDRLVCRLGKTGRVDHNVHVDARRGCEISSLWRCGIRPSRFSQTRRRRAPRENGTLVDRRSRRGLVGRSASDLNGFCRRDLNLRFRHFRRLVCHRHEKGAIGTAVKTRALLLCQREIGVGLRRICICRFRA